MRYKQSIRDSSSPNPSNSQNVMDAPGLNIRNEAIVVSTLAVIQPYNSERAKTLEKLHDNPPDGYLREPTTKLEIRQEGFLNQAD